MSPTPLLRAELRLVVERYLANPVRWRHAVHHEIDQRTFSELHRDDRMSAWLICWNEGADTGFHDHDTSHGAVGVAAGTVIEERLVLGGPAHAQHHGHGQIFDFEASEIHRVRHGGGEPAVTVHAYSPPLSRMGAYVIEPTGTLRREVLDETQELRPLLSEA
jgi:predicted metal-dependent enzyme (double-stranded beta helix superfamily)